MGDHQAAEGKVNSDNIGVAEKANEEPKYRSYREDAGNKATAIQKLNVGRVVWFKTDREGSYKMTVTGASYDSVTNTWSYTLKDSSGVDDGEWVAETRLTAANPSR